MTAEEPIVPCSPTPWIVGAYHGQGTSRWLVAVRMASEGVDAPVGRGLRHQRSNASLSAQAIGRPVRSRRPGETASIFRAVGALTR